MWFRSSSVDPSRRSERGVTLTSYALTMATMVVVALGALTLLEDNSEEFLQETGREIGEPQIPAGDARTAVQASYDGRDSRGSGEYTGSAGAPTVINPNNTGLPNTFPFGTAPEDEFVVGTGPELCIYPTANGAVANGCPSNVNSAPQIGDYLVAGFNYVSVGTNAAGEEMCLQRDPVVDVVDDSVVELAECNNQDPSQRWNRNGLAYVDPDDPTRCLSVEGGFAAGGDIIVDTCSTGVEHQQFGFGATQPPSTTPVLEAAANLPGAPGTNYGTNNDPTSGRQDGTTVELRPATAGKYRVEFEVLRSRQPNPGYSSGCCNEGQSDSFFVDFNRGQSELAPYDLNFATNGSPVWANSGPRNSSGVSDTYDLGALETLTVEIFQRENFVEVRNIRLVPVP